MVVEDSHAPFILVPDLARVIRLGHLVELKADAVDRVGGIGVYGCLDDTAAVVEGEHLLELVTQPALVEGHVALEQLEV